MLLAIMGMFKVGPSRTWHFMLHTAVCVCVCVNLGPAVIYSASTLNYTHCIFLSFYGILLCACTRVHVQPVQFEPWT